MCWEKYAGTTPWPRLATFPVRERRPRSASSSVVLPDPFGPTRATFSPRSTTMLASSSSVLSPAESEMFSASSTTRPVAGRVEEVEAERPPALRERCERPARGGPVLLQPLDLGELCLRLAGLRLLVPEALHEALEPRDVLRDAICRLLGRGGPRSLLAPPLVPRAREEVRASRCQLEHRGRHRLEEPAVVGDEDHGRIQGRELRFEPLEALDVEVIRRLVEEQQIGIDGERACE